MDSSEPSHTTIDEYISGFPPEVQARLRQVRAIIRAAAPEAQEKISYQMPTFTLAGSNLVHFAGYANHIGLYPIPSALEHFKDELAAYKTGKGSVQFPHDRPLPADLIARMVAFRVAENQAKVSAKKAAAAAKKAAKKTG